jgi:hypothetical protein
MVYVLISAFLFTAIAYLIKKRISYVEMYASSIFSIVFQLITDIILEFKYNLYGYFDKGVDFPTFIVTIFIFPSLTIIFLNYFPLNRKLLHKFFYILGWSIFAIIYEYFSVKSELFYYVDWKLWYSALIYPFIYLIIYLNFIWIKKLQKHQDNANV